MHPSTQRAAAIVAVAMAVGLAVWAAARILGVDLDVRMNGDLRQVGPADVVVTTLADGAAVVALMAMHLLVGATLIKGFASATMRQGVGATTR